MSGWCSDGAGAGVSSRPAFLHCSYQLGVVSLSVSHLGQSLSPWWEIICWWETPGLLCSGVVPDLELQVSGLSDLECVPSSLWLFFQRLWIFIVFAVPVEGSNPRPASRPASCSSERQKPEPRSRQLSELLPLPARDQLKRVTAASGTGTVTSQVPALV